MKNTAHRGTLLVAAVGVALTSAGCVGAGGSARATTPPAAAGALDCSTTALKAVALSNATIDSATQVAAGSYTPSGSTMAITNLPAFCSVAGTAAPTSDSIIHFQVWMPIGAAWNGKLVVTGNGGYSPALSFTDMALAIRRGYAVAGGDTGHQSANPNDMSFGVNHLEKIIDWGTRSVHAITDPSKAIVAGLAAKAATQSYYYGCSTGGHQAYAEVQRYPNDFDGVVAGDPGNNRTALNAEFLWRFLSNHATNDNSTPILTPAKTTLITNRAIAACDALDGVTDGVIDDPRVCTSARFSVDSLLCTGADSPTCLTAAQVASAKKIYQGPVDPGTSTSIYPGPPVGSESGWAGYLGTTEPVRSDFWRYWVYNDPGWNWWSFDFKRDLADSLAKVGPYVDQNSADLSAFKAHGGKLITFQGWADPVVSPMDTIAYYQKVVAAQGSQANTDAFFRLFMAPGMGHCSGGAGPNNFGNGGQTAPVIDAQHDLLSALDAWVTQGRAPDQIIASKLTGSTVTRTRPLCAYPKTETYKGSGSIDDAANFTCS